MVAIYGPWGSGKSTLMNFTAYYLERAEEEQRPLLILFNPWWFSGDEDLTRRFFAELQSTLSRKYRLQKIAGRLGDFSKRLSDAPIPYVSHAKPIASLLNWAAGERDVRALKDSVASLLRESPRRFVVMIDDVDRLTAEEIRQVFKLIKAVADFPQITYLLALDKNVAIAALEETQGIPGEEYLEKIVQIPVELPAPDSSALQRLTFEQLNDVLGPVPEGLFNSVYWANLYMEGIRHLIETPRDVARLTNALRLTYPAVREEVNAADFVAIHALSVFAPDVYDIVRKNPHEFAGTSAGLANPDASKAFHDTWIEQIDAPRRAVIRRLLIRLFPRLAGVWGNTTYTSEWTDRWRRERRIASPDVFPIFFGFTVPEGGVGRVEMAALITLAQNEAAFAHRLLELAQQRRPEGGTRVAILLDRLLDHADDAAVKPVAPNIIRALLRIGDKLLRAEDEGDMWSLAGNELRIARAIYWLLPQLPPERRCAVLIDGMTASPAIDTVVEQVARLAHWDEKRAERDEPPMPGEEPRLAPDDHAALQKAALAEIERAAADGAILEAKGLGFILHKWREWGDPSHPRQWTEETVDDDLNLARLLERFVLTSRSQALGDWATRINKRLNPKSLEPFVSVNKLEPRVADLAQDERLTAEQREACRLFLRGMELVRAGRDAGDPSSWDRD